MLEKMPVIVDLYMGIVRATRCSRNFVVGELSRDPERLFQTVLKDPEKIQPILRLRRQIEEEMDKGLLRKMPVIDLVSTLVSLVWSSVVDPQATSGGFWITIWGGLRNIWIGAGI